MDAATLEETAEEPPSPGAEGGASWASPNVSDPARDFRARHFPRVTDRQWRDWRWQLRHRITTPHDLERLLVLSRQERIALERGQGCLPLSITPYYAALLDPRNPRQPLRRCVVPVTDELAIHPGESADPLHEDTSSPVEGLVHRYPDRVLLLTTSFCSTYCRYCTRSRLVGQRSHTGYGRRQWQECLDYIAAHAEIRDVLLSGGDPLTLPDSELDWLLSRLRAIQHVEIIRIGTKVPMVLPQRITCGLLRMLRRHHPLWLSIHCTHPDEHTPEAALACARLADAGIPLGSQTVLLAGVNDDTTTMTRLMHGLLRLRIRPYYLYQCDPILGSAHFRTPVRHGLEMISALRGHTSGYAVPHYVIDAPGGGGKIPLLPETVAGWKEDAILLRNHEGKTFSYPDSQGTAAREVLS